MEEMHSLIRSKLINLAHLLVRFQNRLTVYFACYGLKCSMKHGIHLKRLGSDYGGWWVPESSTVYSRRKILVSAGLGFDVSFDKLMLKDGYFLIGLDPLLKSYLYALEELYEHGNKLILNKGVSTFDGKQKFYAPKIPNHDSWSTTNTQETEERLTNYFDVIALSSLPIDYDDNSFVILKMDIEGGEVKLISEICKKNLKFDYLAVEMDCMSLIPFFSLNKRVRQILEVRKVLLTLSKSGFCLIKNENFNFFWIQRASISKLSTREI